MILVFCLHWWSRGEAAYDSTNPSHNGETSVSMKAVSHDKGSFMVEWVDVVYETAGPSLLVRNIGVLDSSSGSFAYQG